LHSDSQSVANETWTGGKPKQSGVPIEERRMKIEQSPQGPRGVALDRDGKPVHHGHFPQGWKGKRWTLPCLHSVPIKPVPNAEPYTSRLYQFPVDQTHTLTVRFASWRATTPEERAQRTKLWNEVVYPRLIQVAGEDRDMIETLGDLAESRSEEYLFLPDRDVLNVRKMLASAFVKQATDGGATRNDKQDFVFPV
jgi:hypothetical protein